MLTALILLIGMQLSPELHTSINEVRELQKSGHYAEALEMYREVVEPQLPQAPKNLEVNARLLEVLIYRKTGETERGLTLINELLEEIPDSLPVHKMQGLSHKANLNWDALKLETYFITINELYELAKQENDVNRMNRAIGNMYYYFEATSNHDSLNIYLTLLKEHLNTDETRVNRLRFEFYSGIYERDIKKDIPSSILHLARAVNAWQPEDGINWYLRISTEQIKTWLEDGNLVNVESKLNELEQHRGIAENPNYLVMTYSLYVRLYMFKNEPDMAGIYYDLMEQIPYDLLAYQSIRGKVLAELALDGGNIWESDPVFQHARKSGFSGLAMVLIVSGILGAAISIIMRLTPKTSTSSLSDSWRWSLVD